MGEYMLFHAPGTPTTLDWVFILIAIFQWAALSVYWVLGQR